MAVYRLKVPAGIEKATVGAFQKIRNAVVGGYKKIETAFVRTFLEEVGRDD